MLNQNDKIELFAEDINKNADKIVKKIRRQTERFQEQQLSAFEAQAAADYESRTAYAAQRLETETNREIAALRADAKREAVLHRNKIVDAVFAEVKTRLASYTETPAYQALLAKSIRALAESIDGDVTILVRQADVAAAKEICCTVPCVVSVEADSSIVLGLAKATNASRTVFADDTFECRLDAYRESFLEMSNLSIDA